MQKSSLIIAFIALSTYSFAQDILSKEQALDMVMKNNYDIQLSENNKAVAKNNTSIYNSGYLPTVATSAAASYSNNNTTTTLANDMEFEANGAVNQTYSASVAANYTIFDGWNRKYTQEKLSKRYAISETDANIVIENTLISLFNAYYDVAARTENLATQKEILEISKQRLYAAQVDLEYGQGNQLSVLNAQVDVNNDSLNYLNIEQQLLNAKRDLNVILAREADTPLAVDTNVEYIEGLMLEELINAATNQNYNLQKLDDNMLITQLDAEIAKAPQLPKLTANASYGWNNTVVAPVINFSKQNRLGFTAGLNLNWTLFDGGRSKINKQNTQLTLENQTLQRQQMVESLERNVRNAWQNYQTAQYTLEIQQQNITTNQTNFQHTQERFKLGRVSNIDFRQAQLNLQNAQLRLSTAKYDLKKAELQLLQLAAMLVNNKIY